jgi:hypothetical protein
LSFGNVVESDPLPMSRHRMRSLAWVDGVEQGLRASTRWAGLRPRGGDGNRVLHPAV